MWVIKILSYYKQFGLYRASNIVNVVKFRMLRWFEDVAGMSRQGHFCGDQSWEMDTRKTVKETEG